MPTGPKLHAEYNTLKAQAGASNAVREEKRQKKTREHRGLGPPSLITLRTRVQELTPEQSAVGSKVSALEERKARGTNKAKEVGAQLKALEAAWFVCEAIAELHWGPRCTMPTADAPALYLPRASRLLAMTRNVGGLRRVLAVSRRAR